MSMFSRSSSVVVETFSGLMIRFVELQKEISQLVGENTRLKDENAFLRNGLRSYIEHETKGATDAKKD